MTQSIYMHVIGAAALLMALTPGLSIFWPERMVSVDQYSGEVPEVRAPIPDRMQGTRLRIGNGRRIPVKSLFGPVASWSS